MLKRALPAVALVACIGLVSSTARAQQDIRWGTPPVGTAGHKALVTLANLLNKEMPKYRISVLPTAGAIATVKGYATKELDGTYGSDVAFHELATDSGRFKGFKARVQRQPIQSFWSNTIEVGLAVHVRNKEKIRKWGDLAGKRVFTGPLPFDTRAQTERALTTLGVKFTYVQVDLATAGSQLESGALDAMSIYTGSESSPPPWLSEASLALVRVRHALQRDGAREADGRHRASVHGRRRGQRGEIGAQVVDPRAAVAELRDVQHDAVRRRDHAEAGIGEEAQQRQGGGAAAQRQ